jgi:hypothetical protein
VPLFEKIAKQADQIQVEAKWTNPTAKESPQNKSAKQDYSQYET